MDSNQHTYEDLKEMQQWPLSKKIQVSKSRIMEFYNAFNGKVYVSFSGGKDSTVLLDLVRSIHGEVPAVFTNTGLEYVEIQRFVRNTDNSIILTPKMSFPQVITEYGYPLVSKEVSEAIYYARRKPQREREREREREDGCAVNAPCLSDGNIFKERNKTCHQKRFELLGRPRTRRTGVGKETALSLYNKKKWLPLCRDLPARISNRCCHIMKKSPLGIYQRQNHVKPYIGTMAVESSVRKQAWIRHGCNAFDSAKPTSQPLSFWLESDVLQYIDLFHLDYAPVYGDIVRDDSGVYRTTGAERTGCIFCAYGAHLEKESRFQKLKQTHPKQYDYCIGGGQWIDNPDFDPHYDGTPDEFGWVDWNPPKLWVPSKEGLGYAKLFDMANDIMEKAGYKAMWLY